MQENGPVNNAAAVTPSDATDLVAGGYARALYIGVTGDVKVTLAGGATVVFKAVPVGFAPIKARRVWATSTTASSILALF